MRFGAVAKLSVALAVWGSQACSGRARSPVEAAVRLQAAVADHDVAQLWEALDLETRWSWMTVRRAQREAYDIILSNLPEGPTRERQLHRFEPGAVAENDVALFARVFPELRWGELKQALTQAAPADGGLEAVGDDEARLPALQTAPTRSAGPGLRFRRGQDGSWGYAGLGAEAEEAKRRATTDLDLVRTNAADLERAATRAGR